MKTYKRILFVMPNIKIGGIQSAFLNLLNELKNEDLSIDVLCFDDGQNQKLPDFVNTLASNKFLRMLTVSGKQINRENILLGLFRNFCGIIVKLFGQKHVFKMLVKSYKRLNGYDVAISFSQSASRSLYGGFNEFVLYRTDATKKISFIHCDYEKAGINTSYSKEIYKKFDCIAAVSNGVKNQILSKLPEVEDKLFVVYNCHNFEKIFSMSLKEEVNYSADKLNFITISRLSPEKGHKRMLSVFKKLNDDGYDFCWHIVGGGNDSFNDNLSEIISEYGLNEKVKLYGEQSNPYCFIKNADILLVPSFHEAAPMIYSEAFALGVPVLSTNTLSANEFIFNLGYGAVCNNNEEALYQSVKELIVNPFKIEDFRQSIKNNYKLTNETAKTQFLNIINK